MGRGSLRNVTRRGKLHLREPFLLGMRTLCMAPELYLHWRMESDEEWEVQPEFWS
jgi:hypothetical protein